MASHVAARETSFLQAAGSVSPLQCQLRDAVAPADRAAVRLLLESTGFFQPAEVDVAVGLVDECVVRGTASGYQFVFAELDGSLAGYACFGPIPCTAASFDLYWIAVDPRFQRHGIGRTLMAAVESRIAALGGERIYIDTSGREQYAPTRAFYERCGFRREATLEDFYAAGDDRLIYAKAGVSAAARSSIQACIANEPVGGVSRRRLSGPETPTTGSFIARASIIK